MEKAQLLEELPLRELLLGMLGREWRQRLINRGKPNAQIFSEYLDLIAASKSPKWHYETRRLLKDFFDYIGEFPPTIELFTKFFHRYSGLAQSTRSRYYFVFSAFFNWYNGERLPFKIKSPKLVPQVVADSEIDVLEKALEENKRTHKRLIERDRVLLLTARHTGLRRAELADLIISDLHLAGPNPYVRVRHGKGNKQRDVPLNAEILPVIRDFIKGERPEQSVFNLSPKTISGKFRQWSKKAGVDVHAHLMRHKFATDILSRGGNIRAVQKLLGHESLATTEVYLGVTDDSLRDAVSLLAKREPEAANSNGNEAIAVPSRTQTARKRVEITPDGLAFDDYVSGPVVHTRYWNKPFLVETTSDRILINSVEIRTSAPDVPYRIVIFEHIPGDEDEWNDFDLADMEEVTSLAHVWSPAAPMEYANAGGDKGVLIGLVTGWRPMRFDIQGDELLRYFKESIAYDLRLSYRDV